MPKCPMPKSQWPIDKATFIELAHLHNSFFHIIGELWQNVQNFAVKPPTCGSWLHLSFEHIAVISTVDERHGPWKIVVDLLNRNRQTKNHWSVSGRELWKCERAHWMNTKNVQYIQDDIIFFCFITPNTPRVELHISPNLILMIKIYCAHSSAVGQ